MQKMNNEQFENAMYNAGDVYTTMRSQLNRVGTAISGDDPFKLMVELAEMQKLVREAMRFAIEAQEHDIADIKREAQRIA